MFFVARAGGADGGRGLGLLLGYPSLAVVGCVAYLLATRVLDLPVAQRRDGRRRRDLGNTGFLGVPLVATLLGHDDLGAAITYDTLVSGPMFFVVGFAVAAALTTRGQSTGVRLRTFVLRNPPLIAVPRRSSRPTRWRPTCSSTSRACC